MTNRFVGACIPMYFAVLFLAAAAPPLDVESIVAANEDAVLVVTGVSKKTGALVQGSGFCVDTDGLVVATAHQTQDVTQLTGRVASGETYQLTPLNVDHAGDWALLQADRDLPAAVALGNAETLRNGAPLISIAAPNHLDFTTAQGIVSSTQRLYRGKPVIQTDLTASPGSSGGPVFDRGGKLIGMIIMNLEGEEWVIVNPINNLFPLLERHGVPVPSTLHESSGEKDLLLTPATDAAPLEVLAVEAYNKGVKSGNLREKVEHYETATKLLKEFYEAYFNLGVTATAAGDTGKAEAAYTKAAELRPDAAEVQRNLGRLYLREKRFEEALTAFQRARTLLPDEAQSYNDLGETLRQMGQQEEAAAAFLDALRLAPDYAQAHYNLALTYAQSDRATDAVNHLETYLRLRPDAADAAQVRTWITDLQSQ